MRALNKLTTLQLIRNMKHVEYRNGLTTLGEVDESETKLSQYLNTLKNQKHDTRTESKSTK